MAGEDDLGFEEAEETPEPEGSAEPEPWRQEVEALRKQNNDLAMQTTAVLGELMKRLPASAPVPKAPEAPAGNDSETWKLAQQMPEIMPHLVEDRVSKILDAKLGEFQKGMLGTIGRRETERDLSSRLRDLYEDDIQNRDSEILRATPEAKQILGQFLDPSLKDTAVHDQLSYLLAAGMKPGAVAKREVARSKAVEESRRAAADRSSAMGGIGTRGAPKEPTLGEEDEALADRFGINLKDEKVRARILAFKKSEQLDQYGNLSSLGGE